MPLLTFVLALARFSYRNDLSKPQMWLSDAPIHKVISTSYRATLQLLSRASRAFTTQPCSFLYASLNTIPPPHFHSHPLPKVYIPAKPIFTLHSPDFLLHAFPGVPLSTGRAFFLLCICGNRTYPVERQLSKIIMNVNSRVKLPRFKSQLCHL